MRSTTIVATITALVALTGCEPIPALDAPDADVECPEPDDYCPECAVCPVCEPDFTEVCLRGCLAMTNRDSGFCAGNCLDNYPWMPCREQLVEVFSCWADGGSEDCGTPTCD